MRTFTLLTSVLLIVAYCPAQVGIGNTSPDASSLLHVNDGNGDKGILIPSVALLAKDSPSPITAPAVSLLVYNTATSGSGTLAVTPGYYYWDGKEWVQLNNNDTSIYENDGTLATNRTVTQDGNTLEFTGNVGRNALGIKRTDNSTETGISFRNSGNAYDAAIYMEAPNSTGLVIASEGNENNVSDLLPTVIFNNNGTSSFSREISLYEATANIADKTITLASANDDGIIEINENNTFNHRLHANGTSIFNNKQLDLDFRIATTNNANTFFVDGGNNRIGVKTNSPQRDIHIAGTASTMRIEGLSNANNVNNVAADPAPVYVDNNGDLQLQPPLVQTYLAVNQNNFSGTRTITSTTGASVDVLMNTATFTLTQESLIQVNYQFSVSITRQDGTVLTDGASRLYRSWFTINGATTPHYGYNTGTYTNNPDSGSSGGTYASGFYYLNGSDYIQLPAGTHTIRLFARGFGGSFDFQMNFAETTYDRFQVVVHR